MSGSAANRKIREAQRRLQREVNRVNRENKKAVEEHNRKVEQHNRDVNRHNQKVVASINRELSGPARGTVKYRPAEKELVGRVRDAINFDDRREYDVFVSYARIDGDEVARSLAEALEERGCVSGLYGRNSTGKITVAANGRRCPKSPSWHRYTHRVLSHRKILDRARAWRPLGQVDSNPCIAWGYFR